MSTDLVELLIEARRLAASEAASGNSALSDQLSETVIRPLRAAVTGDAMDEAGDPSARPRQLEQRLVRLAERATRLRVRGDLPVELLEATAGLQALVAQFAPDRVAALARLSRSLPPSVVVMKNGPYLVTNVAVSDWLGVRLSLPPQLGFCRCGASKSKPLCDGSHARIGFQDGKDLNRVADRRDSYVGQQVTVFDNRGICAHSGFCTDRLSTAFHVDGDPFVSPSGARMDEIIRAVRACPSGALSFAIDGVEARAQVDQVREPAIEVSKDGPYRVTGAIPLTDGAGSPIARSEGASLEHYSLCRCGKSLNKPFCSGMHWSVNFIDPLPNDEQEPTLFEWAGGLPALLRTTRIFYGKYVPEDELLAPIFARMAPDHPERPAATLSQAARRPKIHSESYGGYRQMISQHLNRSLSEEQRARWVRLLIKSAEDAGLPQDAEFRAAFVAYLEWGSHIAKENSTAGAKPPPDMPVPRWWWVCNAYPDARVSALVAATNQEEERPVQLPDPDEPVSFDAHIKPLFRESDRRSMRFAFDLWSYDDVAQHAAAIRERLQSGTMPCDGAWPAGQVAVFERWIRSGKPA